MKRHPNAHDARCVDQPCDRKVFCRGRCQHHYNRDRHIRNNAHVHEEGHRGVIPVIAKGWGCL